MRSIAPHSEKADELWRVLAKAKFMEWELTSSEHHWRLQSLKYFILCLFFSLFLSVYCSSMNASASQITTIMQSH